MYLTNLKSVAWPVPELIWISQKLGRSQALPTLSIHLPSKKSHMPIPYRLFVHVYSVSRNLRRLEFRVGVANLQSWGMGGRT